MSRVPMTDGSATAYWLTGHLDLDCVVPYGFESLPPFKILGPQSEKFTDHVWIAMSKYYYVPSYPSLLNLYL
jgi:hypothetical protein